MREIHLTPIPTAEYRPGHETDEIELHCSVCDLRFHAEGENLAPLATLLDQAHQQRHQSEGGEA